MEHYNVLCSWISIQRDGELFFKWLRTVPRFFVSGWLFPLNDRLSASQKNTVGRCTDILALLVLDCQFLAAGWNKLHTKML